MVEGYFQYPQGYKGKGMTLTLKGRGIRGKGRGTASQTLPRPLLYSKYGIRLRIFTSPI